MKTRLLPALAVVLLLAHPVASAPLELPGYGFSIEPLDTDPGASPAQALMLFLPPAAGFSPNINVVLQPYDGTIDDYIALSKGQFEQMGCTVIDEKRVSDSEWRCEYTGEMNGMALHWLARAVISNGRVYLVTATATEASWEAVSGKLKSSVDSFALTAPEAAAEE